MMRICMLIDRGRVLRWHVWLADALSERGECEVFLGLTEIAPAPLPRTLEFVRAIERLIYGLDQESAMDPADDKSLARLRLVDANTQIQFDVILDLVGHEQRHATYQRVLTPLFNSVPGEAGALLAALDGGPLRIEVSDSAEWLEPLTAQPAMIDRRVLTKALDNVLSCTIELILKAIDACAQVAPLQKPVRGRPIRPSAPSGVQPLAFVARTLAVKAQKFLGMLLHGGDSWAVAWRLNTRNPLFDEWNGRFRILPDDRRRYYADPFPYCHNGEQFIFVEEFEFASQRGCILVASVGRDGTLSTPRPVIEEPHHLSFPFVFESGGQIWMIPESGAAGRIDLYRAEHFPYRWQYEGPLLSGIAGYDATLLRQNGRLWMFATVGRWKASTSDNLCIFSADQLTGPWHPHDTNPVLLDAALSRAAGNFVQYNGNTFRLAQDCTHIYGGGISVCWLDDLSCSAFSQTVVGRIDSNLPGCHTYNRHAELEVVDVFGPVHEVTHITAFYRSRPMSTRQAAVSANARPSEIAARPN
jgi:hypothetical protein